MDFFLGSTGSPQYYEEEEEEEESTKLRWVPDIKKGKVKAAGNCAGLTSPSMQWPRKLVNAASPALWINLI